MKLSEFITHATPQIIAEWEAFARSCTPAATAMDLEQRRDNVAGMLKMIATDLETPQTKTEQQAKSVGTDSSAAVNTAAAAHGTDRATNGFTLAQMVSEFRALRASVLRLWAEAQPGFDRGNIDEITRFNEAIDQLLAESVQTYAEDVDHVKDLFLGVLGHDLRNPLGAMMMSATVMMAKEGPEWVHAKTASRILSSGARMNGLISDLLDFTRSRLGGGIPITRTPIDLEETCRAVCDEMSAYRPDCAVRFEAAGQLRGSWDGDRVAQALSNLLGNACQHGTRGEPVVVRVLGGGDEVVVSVSSQGPVIPERSLRDIFDPFRQLDPRGSTATEHGSIGLGLYIVQAIATAHQGTVDVTSTMAGTTFSLRLPRSMST